MSAEENERFDRQLYDEIWNRGDLAQVEALVAVDVTFDGQPLGREGYARWVTGFRGAFPDLDVRIERQVASEELVVSRLAWRGTNTAEIVPGLLPGWTGPTIAPTGKPVAWIAMTMHHIVAGRLTEGWLNADMLDLLQQLGAIPTLGAAR